MIETKATPCWVPADVAGKPVEYTDAVAHFTTRKAAELDVRTHDYDGRAVGAVQLTEVCYLASTECGEPYENGDGGGEHFSTAEDAQKALIDEGYTIIDDEFVLCPDADDSECGCLTAVRGPVPTPAEG